MIYIYDYRDKVIDAEYNNLKKHQIQHKLAWRLLEYVVNNYTDYNFDNLIVEQKIKGKPYFKNADLKFNISHCNGIVCCIISNIGEVGIDIERVNRKINNKVINKCFDKEEQDNINIGSAEQNTNFYRYWTLKECFVKTTGNGLSQNIKECVFYKSNKNFWNIKSTDIIDSSKYIFESMLFIDKNNVEDYIISACCEKPYNIEDDIFISKVIDKI